MSEAGFLNTATSRGILALMGLVLLTGHANAQPVTAAPPAAGRPLAPGLITTHAESRRRLPNTVADAVVSIEVHGHDLRGTASALARQSQTLLTFLRAQPTERLRTDGTSFEPETQELRGQPDRIKGYAGRISVSFRTTPDQLPSMLAGCLDNGATALGQFGASPREPEIEAARREMVAEGGESALAQARTIATNVGQRIAGVQLVEVDPLPRTGPDPIMFAQAPERAARPAPPMRPIANEAGDSGLSVTQVAGLALALFAVVVFEAAGAWYLNSVDTGALKLIAGAVCIAGLALYLAWLTLRDLAGTLEAFTPDPLRVFGRQVSQSAAPGLWRVIAGLAAGQDALMPDHVVVGLHDGFFVTSSSIRLGPDDVPLQGRTLYLSAPDLALLDHDEVAAVIAHELAHFSGEDTVYTQRFLPVYAGIDRILWAICQGSAAAQGGVLLRPAESLGLHLMATFDAAVQHWSRLRELAAEQASALPAGPRAAASALIRTGLIAGVADASLKEAIHHPQAAPPDLVAAIVQRATVTGLGDPGAQLAGTQPHPTDSHPANAQRIEALGVAADDILLAHAGRPVDTEDTHLRTFSRTGRAFASP